MGDPDLRSDETVLVRTQEVYVKSIPFEGILTNKRIVLVDRAKNLLPPKEIPLATIKDVEGGENANRDPVVTVTVITRTGETRQMVLTFSRTSGGNRNKERDDWVKTLKDNVSSSFEQVIRKVIPGFDQPQRRPEPSSSPRVEGTGTPVQPVATRPLVKKEADTIHPIKKIIENAPSKTPFAAITSDVPVTGFGTFCSHCGNKVPEDSGFCNRCGSSIIPPGITVPVKTVITDTSTQAQRPTEPEIQASEPRISASSVQVPASRPRSSFPEPIVQKSEQRPYSPLYDNPPESFESPEQPAPAASTPKKKPAAKPLIPRLFSPKELAPTPLKPVSMQAAASPPPQKSRGASRMPGKKVFISIGVIILLIAIAAVGVVFVYPMISSTGISQPGSPTPSSTPVTTSTTPVSSGTIVIRETTAAPSVPSTGVYAHISYLGSWKGTYGLPAALQTIANSGDRFYEIENATGPVEVNIEKLDGSTRHDLVVEIYKNGGLLTSGTTSAGFGKVTVSADATTGVAQPPKVTASNQTLTPKPTTAAGNVTSTMKPVTNVTTVKTTAAPATNVTTVKTTTPVTKTTTASP
jgi:hypothetical protein